MRSRYEVGPVRARTHSATGSLQFNTVRGKRKYCMKVMYVYAPASPTEECGGIMTLLDSGIVARRKVTYSKKSRPSLMRADRCQAVYIRRSQYSLARGPVKPASWRICSKAAMAIRIGPSADQAGVAP